MNINVHIEQLILDGLTISHEQQPLLQAAVEAELTRLLAADGISASMLGGGTLSNVHAATINLTNEGNSSQLGQQIAQAVYGGIGR